MAGGNLPFGFAPSGSLTNYTPTLREKATDWLRTKLFSDDRAGQGRAEKVMDVAQFTPFGFGMDIYDAGREGAQGNYGAAALTLGMAGVPGPSPKGIRAYHGSPHDFDEFSMSKIGTGEGAQAYGHGLYFAENEAVAQGYRDALRRKGDKITFDGKPLERPRDFTEIQNQLENVEGDWRAYKAIEEITSRQGDMADRLADIRNWYRNQPEMLAAVDRAEKRMNLIANPGKTYEVEINADPDAFLDWDKPLSEQPEAMAKLRDHANRINAGKLTASASGKEEIGGSSPSPASIFENYQFGAVRASSGGYHPRLETPDGQRIYRDVTLPTRDAATQAGYDRILETVARPKTQDESKFLKEAGIPGIKYLDAGSRGAGDGTRNYVVFDEKLISIVKKYGIAGASAMLGYNILEGMDPAQAEELQRIEGNQ